MRPFIATIFAAALICGPPRVLRQVVFADAFNWSPPRRKPEEERQKAESEAAPAEPPITDRRDPLCVFVVTSSAQIVAITTTRDERQEHPHPHHCCMLPERRFISPHPETHHDRQGRWRMARALSATGAMGDPNSRHVLLDSCTGIFSNL